jgi:hypothetical protein
MNFFFLQLRRWELCKKANNVIPWERAFQYVKKQFEPQCLFRKSSLFNSFDTYTLALILRRVQLLLCNDCEIGE